MSFLVFILVCLLTAAGQVSTATQPAGRPPGVTQGSPQLLALLSGVEQTGRAASLDIAQMRIEKWKGDKGMKQQQQQNADLLLRNLTSALPTMLGAVRTAPEDFAANFKLYRNLGALYDVLAVLAESAGAFGPKDEFQALAAHAANLDNARRAVGDRLEMLAVAKDAEIARLRGQTRGQAATTGAPRKIIVDDEPKKPAKKKKPSPATRAAPKTGSQ